MLAMCDLVAEDTTQIIDLVIVVICCWTSMRAEDITYMLSKNVAKIESSSDYQTPRLPV